MDDLKTFAYTFTWQEKTYSNYIYAESLKQAEHQLSASNVSDIQEVEIHEVELRKSLFRLNEVL